MNKIKKDFEEFKKSLIENSQKRGIKIVINPTKKK